MSGDGDMLDEVTPDLVRRIEEGLAEGRNDEVRSLLAPLSGAGQAHVLEQVSEPQRDALVGILKGDLDPEALPELDEEVLEDVLEQLDSKQIAAAARELETDDAATILEELPEAERREVLAELPADFSLPVVCVQHIGREFLAEMLGWLAASTPLSICRAVSGELPAAGRAYFAPEDAHVEFDTAGRLLLSHAAPRDGHRPSVTVTMNAAARQFGAAAAGVLLTGMGRDGADGMLAIARAGGVTIAQDEASSVIYGMPGSAVALGAAGQVLPLAQIAPMLRLMAACAESGARRTN